MGPECTFLIFMKTKLSKTTCILAISSKPYSFAKFLANRKILLDMLCLRGRSAGEGKRGHLPPPPPWPAKIVCFSTFLNENSMFLGHVFVLPWKKDCAVDANACLTERVQMGYGLVNLGLHLLAPIH